MSDEDDNAAGDGQDPAEEGQDLIDPSRLSRYTRVKMFLEAAGLPMNDMLDILRRKPLRESDVVTDEHRELVIDLKASGCPDDVVARFFGISGDKCRRLFDWELDNGLQLRTGQVVRGLLINGVQLGDTSAQMGYLKLQPDLKWGSKHKNENIEPPPDPEDVQQQRKENEAFIAGITAGLSIDTTKFKPANKRTPQTVTKDKPKQVVYTGIVKKAKGE
jgi:hypothetical protein